MHHLETEDERQAFVQECALDGLKMVCAGPLNGQKHRICRLPEETKQATEAIVRPLLREQRATVELGTLALQ